MAGPVNVKATVTGLDQLKAQLEAMGKTVGNRIARKAITAGISIVAKDAKSLAPVRSGTLRRSMGTKVKTLPNGKTIGLAGPRRGFKKEIKGHMIDPAKYGHLAEGGRGPVSVKNKKVLYSKIEGRFYGKSVGPAAGSRFLERAWSQDKASVEETIAKVMREEIAGLATKAVKNF